MFSRLLYGSPSPVQGKEVIKDDEIVLGDDDLREAARRWAADDDRDEGEGSVGFTKAITSLICHKDIIKLRQQQTET